MTTDPRTEVAAPELNGAAPVADLRERIDAKRADWFREPAPGSNAAPKFVPKRAADALAAETPVAVGGEQLWIHDGSYVRGEDDLRRRIGERLGDSWRPAHTDDTLRYLRDVSPRLWDRPLPDRVACANGILNLSDPHHPRLDPPDPGHLSTVRIAPAFDPSATCPVIDTFAEQVLGVETAPLLFEIAGYLIVPDNSLHKAFMLTGNGENGKSTALNLLTAFVGRENVAACSLHKLEEDRFAVADLYGRLVNVCADLDARELRSTSIFKEITGGDVMRGEVKYRPAFTFTPFSRLVFSANEPPPTSDASRAFWRRWIVLPFDATFGPGQRDEHLIDKLSTPGELSGMLNRAIAGLADLRERSGFAETGATGRGLAEFRRSADTVAGFFETCCVADPEARTPRPAVHRDYARFCKDAERQPVSPQKLYGRLRTDFGVAERTVQGADCFVLRLDGPGGAG